MKTKKETKENLQSIAKKWRLQDSNKERKEGIVLIWEDQVYGWKNCLRDPSHEQPGALAVDIDGNIFIAEGGNSFDGARTWTLFQ